MTLLVLLGAVSTPGEVAVAFDLPGGFKREFTRVSANLCSQYLET